MPNYPKEFELFKGPIIHSAEWDSTTDLVNKVVGIVGSGASAIQIIPSIAPEVKELHCYQRKPAWVKSKPLYHFSGFTKWAFKTIPLVMWLYRCILFLVSELLHNAFLHNSYTSKLGMFEVIWIYNDELCFFTSACAPKFTAFDFESFLSSVPQECFIDRLVFLSVCLSVCPSVRPFSR